MLQRITRSLLIRWSLPLFVVLVAAGVIGAYFASKVDLKLSLTDLLPENHPAVVKFEKLTEVVGGVGYLAIVLHAEDGKSHLEAAGKIKQALEGNPYVRTVFDDREERFFVDRLLYYLEIPKLEELEKNIDAQVTAMRRKLFDLGLFDDEKPEETPKQAFDDDLKKRAQRSAKIEAKLISGDHKHLLLMIKPTFDSTDLSKTKELVAQTEQILSRTLPANVTYDFTERYYNKIVETELIQRDIFLLGTLSILAIGLILLTYLRSIRALILIFVPVFMGLGITGGLTYLAIGHINIVTGFLMGIVSGLGVDYGIHLYLRLLLEKREPSSDDPDPIWRTLYSSGHAVFTGAMAAAFAFFLLCFSTFRAFSEFGFICGVGITAVLLCLLCGFRPLVRLLRLDGPIVAPAAGTAPIRRGRFPVLPLPKGYYVGLLVTVVLTTLGLTVRFEYDFDKMLRHSVTLERLAALVDDIYGRSVVPSALATESKDEAIAIEKRLREKYMPGMVQDLISGATIVPEHQAEKQVILQRIEKKLADIKDRFIEKSMGVPASAVRTWLAAKPFTFQDLPLHIQDMLRGTQQSGFLLYVYPAIKLGEASAIHRYAAMVRDIESTYPNTLTGSDAVIFSDILNLIQRDGARILFVIFFAVGAFIWLNTRKLGPTLTTYLPLLISLPVGMGLMALFGVRFNIFNITIIPTFVAMGIDVPIHIVHRAMETGSGYKAAKDLAPSINLALMTAALGFGVLVFANANVLKSLGWIAILGTLAIWWVGLFVLPAFLEWAVRRKQGKTTATQA
jgi:predicted RND superfamily exporter protein